MWRNADDTERAFIRREFIPKEIASAILVVLLDIGLILVITSWLKDLYDMNVPLVMVALPIVLFLIYVFYYTFRAIYKSIRTIHKINANNFTVAECKISKVNVHRIGLINNANIVASTSDGEEYRTSYSSPFTTSVMQDRSALLVSLGEELEIVLT